jgi:hypothetical protein
MISREKIIEEIEKVPDEHLDEHYRIIKDFEVKKENGEAGESVMARLRRIKYSASPDFSMKANLYDIEADNTK